MQSSDPGTPAALLAGIPADLPQQLQPSHVVSFLQAALGSKEQQGTGRRLQAICKLPAAQMLDADIVLSLLQSAVQHPDGTAVEPLLTLAGVQQIDAASINSLLAAALATGNFSRHNYVCGWLRRWS
jgi:hypothetical protein